MYLDKKLVLYTVDTATIFYTGRFLNNMSAKEILEALHSCQIDIYLSPLNIITYDIGNNFDSTKFHIEAKILGIICYQIHLEAH